MKRFLLVLLALLTLSSCGKKEYRTHFTEHDVNALIFETLDRDRFVRLQEDEIEFVLSIDDDDWENAWVFQDESGKSIDEIGIFVTDANNADRLYGKLEAYVTDCKATKKEWLESYNPPEAEKLQNGKLFRFGNCMGYSFLNRDEQDALSVSFQDFCLQK